MKATRKMWLCVGAFTTLAAGCSRNEQAETAASAEPAAAAEAATAANAAAPVGDVYKGNFSGALSKLLAGEGGEEGIGTSFSNGNIVIPALNGAQITEAFTGNTLSRKGTFAVHFEAGGQMSGWEYKWEPVADALCAAKSSEYIKRDDGSCARRALFEITAGQWSVQDGKFCTVPVLTRAANGKDCVSVYVVLDDIALFAEGAMIGKGNKLLKGKQLEPKS